MDPNRSYRPQLKYKGCVMKLRGSRLQSQKITVHRHPHNQLQGVHIMEKYGK